MPLLRAYRNVAGDGRITLDQVVEAETLHIIHELRDGSHTLSSDGGTPTIPRFTYLPEFWKSQNSQLNNSEAARSAAILITRGFLRPQDTPAKSIQRGNDAVLIFNVMMQ